MLGVLTYLASYFPMVSRLLPNGDELVEKGSTLPVDLVLLAGLLAAVSLLPKAKNYLAAVTAVSLLGALLLIQDAIDASGSRRRLWVAVTAAVVQAGVAISALLLDAGVITAPAPAPQVRPVLRPVRRLLRPAAGPLPAVRLRHAVRRLPVWPEHRRLPRAAGPAAELGASQHGSPTPPTGFPSFSPPPSSGSGDARPGQSGAEHGRSGPQPALVRLGSAAAGAIRRRARHSPDDRATGRGGSPAEQPLCNVLRP